MFDQLKSEGFIKVSAKDRVYYVPRDLPEHVNNGNWIFIDLASHF